MSRGSASRRPAPFVLTLLFAAAIPVVAVAQDADPSADLSPEDSCQPQPDCRLMINPPTAGQTIGLSETTRSRGIRAMRRKPVKPVDPSADPPVQHGSVPPLKGGE